MYLPKFLVTFLLYLISVKAFCQLVFRTRFFYSFLFVFFEERILLTFLMDIYVFKCFVGVGEFDDFFDCRPEDVYRKNYK